MGSFTLIDPGNRCPHLDLDVRTNNLLAGVLRICYRVAGGGTCLASRCVNNVDGDGAQFAQIHHWELSKLSTDRKSTRLNSSHGYISYAVFCLKKKKNKNMKTVHMQIQ